MITRTIGSLVVNRFEDRTALGQAAATAVARTICQLLSEKEYVNMVFAAAPSQNEFLEALCCTEDIAWSRVNAFHMDEYVGLPPDARQRFGNFLKERIFDKLPFHQVHYLGGSGEPGELAGYYAQLLAQHPTDIVCMGIGENCHIAFNDPHVADFNDPKDVKVVSLDQQCRQQQVNDGCFAVLRDVPTHAVTLTVPALLRAPFIFCMVPGPTKAEAIYHTLTAEITPLYPSTALRRHPNAQLFIDSDSALLSEKVVFV